MKATHLGWVLVSAVTFGCAGEALDPAPPTESKPGAVEANATEGEPCDVRAVFDAYCASCHAGPNYYTSKAPVLTFSRAELASTDETGSTLAERVALRLSDAKDPMPPLIYISRPTDAERALVTEWLTAGMPEGSCGK